MIRLLSELIGANEGALRLLVSLLLGYPLAFLHRHLFYGKPAHQQHIYFITCGLFLCTFNFGTAVIHSVLNLFAIYLLLLIIPGTVLSLVLAFLINFGYLCWGYWLTMSYEYSFSWTMPHCVLTLRLTGLVFDVYDGKQKQERLSAEQQETALPRVPSLLEMGGHVYFFGGFLVGPQFPMKRYQDFVGGVFTDKVTGSKPHSVGPALKRLALGIAYTAVYQVTSMYLPDSYLLSSNFQSSSFYMKCFIILIWGKLLLYKYVACWLITEGACILSGLTFNGKDENGNDLWNYCANIHVNRYETASTLHELIEGFNVNTNKWMAKYIYKRMKFANSKNISSLVTMFVLALWHGLYSGYFVNFAFEFFVLNFERQVGGLIISMPGVKTLVNTSQLKPVVWFLKKIYAQFLLSYALVGFCLLTVERYSQVYNDIFWFPHVVCVSWTLIYPLLKPRRTHTE